MNKLQGNKPKCDECEYFIHLESMLGNCVRNPPSVFVAVVPMPSPEREGHLMPVARDFTVQPTTHPHAWCGEWKKAFQLALN